MTIFTSARTSGLLLAAAVGLLLSQAVATDSDTQCLNTTDVTYLAFFPCLPSDNIIRNGVIDCDVFAYAAAVLAHEQSNNDLLNINLLPLSSFNRTVPSLIMEETFDDDLILEVLRLVGSQVLTSLRGVIVPPSESISAQVTEFFSTRFVNATVMGYGSTNSALDKHPEFSRTIPTDVYGDSARLLLMKMFGWVRIGVMALEGDTNTRLYANFLKRFDEFVESSSEAMITHASTYMDSPDEVLEQFKLNNLRIFVGYFGPEDARAVLCKASSDTYRLTTSDHVWILPAYQQPDWWKLDDSMANTSNCSNEQMIEILNSAIFIDPIKLPPVDISLGDFQLQLISKAKWLFPLIPDDMDLTPYLPHSHAVSAYDAITQLSKAISTTIECGTFDNQTALQSVLKDNLLGCEWCRLHYNCCNNSELSGCLRCPSDTASCSAPEDANATSETDVALEEYGQVLVSQFINGVDCPIGVFWSLYDTGSCNFLSISELETHSCSRHLNLTASYFSVSPSCRSNFYWKGRSSPPDSGLPNVSFISVPKQVFSAVLVLIGLAVVTTALVFNIRWRNNKYVKQSSPRLNVVMILAGPLIFVNPVIRGLSYSIAYYGISDTAANALCILDVWTLFPSVMLFYCPLFLKNWRLYRIFYNKQLRQRAWFMTDKSLFALMVPMTLPVFVVLILWTSIQTPKIDSFPVPTTSQIVIVNTCSSTDYQLWFASLVGYITLVFLTTVALSFLTARVPRGLRKEGKVSQRGLTLALVFELPVYGVITFITIVLPAHYEVAWWLFIINTQVIIIAILCILFIPNMVRVYKSRVSLKKKRRQNVTNESNFMGRASELRVEKARLDAELKETEERIEYLKEQRRSRQRQQQQL